MVDDEAFFDLLSKFQSRRIDDQRCSFRPAAPQQAQAAAAPSNNYGKKIQFSTGMQTGAANLTSDMY